MERGAAAAHGFGAQRPVALPVTFAHGALTPRGNYGPAARHGWTPGAAVSTRSVACGAPVGERTAHRAQRRSVRASAAQELRG